ncbi:RNA methyltransferase [Halobacteria archaeon AArc-m2/3/4]|uniref:RNA methyltransferase n=1 Tax=Natronoglomus mannanivorans TaxID=2979990 RepID=A0AAP3E127_9EURY|nr:RNA methyltransferase [Halobacteria archaeon AArc-xg1-1]MCU4971368.1 RNA methyltransferase [Halobacteria archaeon AArc-m2/3/4]
MSDDGKPDRDRTPPRTRTRTPTTPAVAVVDAQTPGNVGTIARAMKNFGFEELLLIDPPELDPDGEAYGFAGHARDDVLPNAVETTFDDLVANYHTIGCTAVTNEDDDNHVRFPFSTPADLAERLPAVDGPTALVFGRERVGLTNAELARIDEICSIPASEEYPALNLGQAATITLYELRELALEGGRTQLPDLERVRAPEPLLERLYDQWDDLLVELNHPEEKREKTMRMVRRVYGRVDLTEREATTFLGLLRRATERPDRKE